MALAGMIHLGDDFSFFEQMHSVGSAPVSTHNTILWRAAWWLFATRVPSHQSILQPDLQMPPAQTQLVQQIF